MTAFVRHALRVSSRERIDRAALELLAQHGYEGTSMQAVADAVGLHKSSLFHHYKGKKELADGVMAGALTELLDLASARLKEEPQLEQLEALTRDLVFDLADEPAKAKLFLRLVLTPPDAPLALATARSDHPVHRLMVLLIDWFARARKAGVIRHVRIRHALMDLIGMVLFHPAAAEQLVYLTGEDPHGEDERAKRADEVAAWVRAALAP